MLGCSVLVENGFSNSRLSADSLFTFRFSRSIYNRHALACISIPHLCKAPQCYKRAALVTDADSYGGCAIQL